jgi:hypothetical protein
LLHCCLLFVACCLLFDAFGELFQFFFNCGDRVECQKSTAAITHTATAGLRHRWAIQMRCR